MINEDTIAAIATPPGLGGIGIIKISGPKACTVAPQIFRPSKPTSRFSSHHLYHGFIVSPDTGNTLDEVLLVVMRAPHTYTREDVVEIHTHSSMAAINAIMELVLKQGIRPAEPGEFTKRAFLNGRIDLTQAEAVIDLITSKTDKGLRLAAQQLKGDLFDLVQSIRKALIETLARIEAVIDFPEEMEEEDEVNAVAAITESVISPLNDLLDNYETAQLYREGLDIIIIGRPNVGKSSLLNRLLKRERAIVTHIPGTTRDIIEEGLTIKGIPIKIIDTAGLRQTTDTVETMGIRFTKERLDSADLVLFMIDTSESLTTEDLSIFNEIKHRTKIILANKVDLPTAIPLTKISQHFPGEHILEISAKFNTGIAQLLEVIYKKIIGSKAMVSPSIAPNLRHKRALERALSASKAVLKLISKKDSPALIAIELQEGLDALGEITGETTNEDILDEIFSRFCIGK
ncbi:MAG: tRNA uridine-5-carboxymethylaminomethyl(34) synthesis GTPase MnmE [Deltaproteobacteria bacterium]|nr:tRNA uridine-5-carboxymethylaminomethyl(34) synthesis GTPase MnmE [Deltaproteobacteria bacterium]